VKWRAKILVAAAALVLLAPLGASFYYRASAGKGCTSCHEIDPAYNQWSLSTHRGVACSECHGDAFSMSAGFHLGNLRRVATHLAGRVSDPVRLRGRDLPAMLERCRKCHAQEFAAWRSGPHASTYARLFLDPQHNASEPLNDDCLRCHGMHFEGGVRDLVAPLSTRGPWLLLEPRTAALPAIPCLACHRMHTGGAPLPQRAAPAATPGPKQELFRPSLAFFDRRARLHYAAASLPMPAMLEGARPVRISPDPRQALCYQCHAPLAGAEAWSGDDRTPLGVHEGLSCLACHARHGLETRASCAHCHPRLSNCGRDVETMDTTFRDPKSAHNIHTVRCLDCHPKGVPRKPSAAPRT
jgi:hypothetical protein